MVLSKSLKYLKNAKDEKKRKKNEEPIKLEIDGIWDCYNQNQLVHSTFELEK